MVVPLSGGPRYQALRHSRRVLERMAPLVRYGLFAVGVSVFLDRVGALVSDAQFTWGERRLMGIVALVTLGGFGLAGWVAGRLIKASADLIEVVIAGAEASGRTADLIELHVVPTLGRIALALERAAPSAEQGDREEGRDATTRRAIDRLNEHLDAARRDDDADRAIDCRDALTEHMRGEPLKDLDRHLVRWLVGRVQARARSGTATGAVAAAELASRVVASFGDTAEGASLRAALPALRRGAGLCPRCARPDPAAGDVCPRCARAGAWPIPPPNAPESEAIP